MPNPALGPLDEIHAELAAIGASPTAVVNITDAMLVRYLREAAEQHNWPDAQPAHDQPSDDLVAQVPAEHRAAAGILTCALTRVTRALGGPCAPEVGLAQRYAAEAVHRAIRAATDRRDQAPAAERTIQVPCSTSAAIVATLAPLIGKRITITTTRFYRTVTAEVGPEEYDSWYEPVTQDTTGTLQAVDVEPTRHVLVTFEPRFSGDTWVGTDTVRLTGREHPVGRRDSFTVVIH